MIEVEHQWLGLSALASILACVHLWYPWFDRRFAVHEARWMGFVGGIATGYVILYLLPKIATISSQMVGPDQVMPFGHLRMYLLLLAAMISYLLMIHLNAGHSRWRPLARGFDWTVHGAYSLLIGYVLVEIATAYVELNLLIALIFGLHLLGMNHIVRSSHTARYDAVLRWIYCLLVLTGAALGLLTELPKPIINGMTACLAGIILINVVAEEVPLHNRDRVPWYLVGVGFYLLASFTVIYLGAPAAG